jgi:Raf kinase inhibitor-like YbhB/YbcL family protein
MSSYKAIGLGAIFAVAVAVAASSEGARQMPLKLTSAQFHNMSPIPKKYTCEGGDVSPPLAWADAPYNTKSFALIVDDPDAPDPRAPKRTWVHWLVYNLPADTSSLGEGLTAGALPLGAAEGVNDFRQEDYGGPCPPIGRHRYFFKLYALDERLNVPDRPDKATLERAMQGHVLEKAELVGTYEKVR